MSNLTPFEIRLELLKMAKDMLVEEYFGKRDAVSQDWQIKVEVAKLQGGVVIPDHPPMPPYPTENDIITKAQTLNGFVSNIQSVDKPKSKSST
jgi:hypothetical protein